MLTYLQVQPDVRNTRLWFGVVQFGEPVFAADRDWQIAAWRRRRP
jgi:hypothetical protein